MQVVDASNYIMNILQVVYMWMVQYTDFIVYDHESV